MPQYPSSPATKRVVLFDARGDSCAETGGALEDLLASAGSLDPEGMTVVWVDGPTLRALPLTTALIQTFDARQQAAMVATFQQRAAGYIKLAGLLETMLPTRAPEEPEPPEAPAGEALEPPGPVAEAPLEPDAPDAAAPEPDPSPAPEGLPNVALGEATGAFAGLRR